MSKILVTGGNGFVATQVLIVALKRGYTVVATVRNQQKADESRASLRKYLSESQLERLSYAVIPDITKEDAFVDIVKQGNFEAVLHTATPFHFNFEDPSELLDPAIGSTKTILKTVKEYGPTVKRVVITSSFAAIRDLSKGFWPGYAYSEKDWNPITWEMATGSNKSTTYYGAKTWAEKAAWDFIAEEKPHFDLVTLNPPYVFGETAQALNSLKDLNTSSAYIYKFLSGQEETPVQTVTIWVDVTDLAEAHLNAVEIPEAGNQRFLITEGTWNHRQVVDILKKLRPESADKVASKLPAGFDEDGWPTGGYFTGDNSRSKNVLKLKYRPLEESLRRMLDSISHLEA